MSAEIESLAFRKGLGRFLSESPIRVLTTAGQSTETPIRAPH
jgi:hypothetical protein